MKGRIRLSQGSVAFVLTLVMATTVNWLVQGQLTQVSGCTCPGDTVVYTCSVTGTGFTIWNGSAFNCPNSGSQILLSHSLFGSSGASGSCNGALSGRSIGVSGSRYTSQLMVNLAANSSLIGKGIECVHRSSGGTETVIGSSIIQLADRLPPPSNVRLADTSPTQLTFNWGAVANASTCPSVQYGLSSNCGSCTNDSRATQTSKTCAIEQSTTTEKQCYFSVQTLICGNVAGILSERINLLLKVPGPPLTSNIRVLPHYNASDQRLLVLDMEFDELLQSEFFISDRVSGSVLSYTITYSNSATNTLCDSLTIYPNQSCSQGMCAVPSFDPIPCSQTVNDRAINVAISATNVLGNGPPSIIPVDFINRVVKISFESDTRIVCTFLREGSSKLCDIDYGVCGLQLNATHREGQMNSSGMVIIDLSLEGLQSRVYCYTVNASSDDTSVFVTGARIRDSYNNNSGPNAAAIVLGLFMGVFVILSMAAGAIIIVLLIVQRSRRTNLTRYKSKATEPQSLPGSRMGSQTNLLSSTSRSGSRRESVDLSSGSVSAGPGPGVLAQKINVSAHIKFNIEDKPRELVKALKKLEDGGISIRTIRSHPFTGKTEGTPLLKTIYIEFENDLTTANEAAIEKMKLGHGNSLVVSCKPTTYYIDIYDSEDFHSLTSKLKVIDEAADEEPHEDKDPHSITAV